VFRLGHQVFSLTTAGGEELQPMCAVLGRELRVRPDLGQMLPVLPIIHAALDNEEGREPINPVLEFEETAQAPPMSIGISQ
jgi:hypothetical protein